MSFPTNTIAPAQLLPPSKPPSPVHLPSQIPTTFPDPTRSSNRVSVRQAATPIDPTVLWTSSIARRCKTGRLAEAVAEFARMRISGVEPNHITIITFLSACADFPLDSRKLGASVHGYALKLGLDKENVMVGTALIDMYSKFGKVGLARVAFDEMREKNSMSWNTMIDGYMKCRQVGDAVEMFDRMPERDAISWTAMINGFVKMGDFDRALECFYEMQCSGVRPDYVAVIAVLAACADLGALSFGLWINRFVMKQDFRDNVRICNSLIDMYSRCGCIEFARDIFKDMCKRTVVSWNSIIVGFAINGHPEEALEYFKTMQKEGFSPDGVSFTGALTACSHAGLVDEGLFLFHNMKNDHKISPRIEHYGCLVDLYARAGRLKDAMNVVQNMPMKPNEVVFGSLLASCRTHGDISLAERLMKHLLKVDPGGDSNYVLLSNIYAASGKWSGASNVRRTMKARGIQKKPGFSSIEIDCRVHKFKASDKSHVDSDGIHDMLNLLSLELKTHGYVSDAVVSEDVCKRTLDISNYEMYKKII